MMELVISNDTLTPWIDRKISADDALKQDLLESLGEIFVEEISESDFVPRLSDTLVDSPYEHMVFTNALEAMGLQITWTGEDAPAWEFQRFQGKEQGEDYALSNYYGSYYYPNEYPQTKSHWVEKGLDIVNQAYVESFIGKKFLQWLLGTL